MFAPTIYRAQGSSKCNLTSENEKTVAIWALRNNKHAGATTDTLSSAKCLYLAIRVNDRVYGVVGIYMGNGQPLDAFENSVLLSILGECVNLNQSVELMDEVIAEALRHVNRRQQHHNP